MFICVCVCVCVGVGVGVDEGVCRCVRECVGVRMGAGVPVVRGWCRMASIITITRNPCISRVTHVSQSRAQVCEEGAGEERLGYMQCHGCCNTRPCTTHPDTWGYAWKKDSVRVEGPCFVPPSVRIVRCVVTPIARIQENSVQNCMLWVGST